MTRPLSILGAPAEKGSAPEVPILGPQLTTDEAERFWKPGTDTRTKFLSPEIQDDLREALLAELIFAARGLALRNLGTTMEDVAGGDTILLTWCRECQMYARDGVVGHTAACQTGRVLRIDDGLLATLEPEAERAEIAPAEGVRDKAEARRSCASESKDSVFSEEYGEPWHYHGTEHVFLRVENSEGYLIATVGGAPQEALDHAERIVACVNVCAGIPTEALLNEKPLASMQRNINDLIKVWKLFPVMKDLRASQGVAR